MSGILASDLLRAVRADIAERKTDGAEVKERLGLLEGQTASLSRRLDWLAGDVVNIKRRLDSVPAG